MSRGVGEKLMDKTLTWFIWIWVSLVVVLYIIVISGESFWTKWPGIMDFKDIIDAVPTDIYPVFMGLHSLILLLVLFPAIAAYFWRERRRAKMRQSNI